MTGLIRVAYNDYNIVSIKLEGDFLNDGRDLISVDLDVTGKITVPGGGTRINDVFP